MASRSVSEAGVEALDALRGLHLQSNDFALMGCAPAFAIDTAALEARWKQLQRLVHPDRFATHDAATQRVAMQWSVRINEAFQRLKEPVKRATYWCALQGAPVNAESNTAMPAAFLMQQMEWREALDDAHTEAALDGLLAHTRRARADALDRLAQLIDVESNPAAAVDQVRALMFIDRFAEEVRQRLDRF